MENKMRKNIYVILLLVASNIAILCAYLINAYSDEEHSNGRGKNLYLEFILASDESLDLSAYEMLGREYDRICLYSLYGIDLVANEEVQNRVSQAFEEGYVADSDGVWPLVLFGDAGEEIFHISHFDKPFGLESGPHCWFLSEVAIAVVPPGLRRGDLRQGQLSVSSLR
jgi:hypothetical protein